MARLNEAPLATESVEARMFSEALPRHDHVLIDTRYSQETIHPTESRVRKVWSA